MGYDPRWIPPNHLVEVTSRTIHARYLLRPCRDLVDVFNGVLARAATLYDVEVVAFVALSNHLHLLVVPADTRALSLFMTYFLGNLAKEIGRLHGFRECVFPRRYSHVVVSDEPEAQEARLRYILSHGCKENLVKRPEDWPGPSSTEALITGRTVCGVWFDRSDEYEASKRDKQFTKYEFSEVHDLALAPLPCWASLPPEERRSRVKETVRQITAETRQKIEETGCQPLGVKRILRQNPRDRPARPKRSPKPIVHATTKAVRKAMKIEFYVFRKAYRYASEQLRAGDPLANFPPGSHRPPLPYLSAQPP